MEERAERTGPGRQRWLGDCRSAALAAPSTHPGLEGKNGVSQRQQEPRLDMRDLPSPLATRSWSSQGLSPVLFKVELCFLQRGGDKHGPGAPGGGLQGSGGPRPDP